MSLTNQTMKVLGPGSPTVCVFLHVSNYPLIVLVDCRLINSQYPLVVSVEYFRAPSFPLKNFSSFKFRIINMITVSCRFAYSSKIMCIPHPVIPFRVPPQPVQALCSGRGGKIDVLYIRCLDGRVPEAYELWAISEYGVREVHPPDRVRILEDFREDTFHAHFFNAWRLQIPFLGRRSGNMSVKFIDAARATQQVGSCVTTCTENICVHSWGPYPTMIHHTFSTIKWRAYNSPVNPHALEFRANHERLWLIHVDRRQTLQR